MELEFKPLEWRSLTVEGVEISQSEVKEYLISWVKGNFPAGLRETSDYARAILRLDDYLNQGYSDNRRLAIMELVGRLLEIHSDEEILRICLLICMIRSSTSPLQSLPLYVIRILSEQGFLAASLIYQKLRETVVDTMFNRPDWIKTSGAA